MPESGNVEQLLDTRMPEYVGMPKRPRDVNTACHHTEIDSLAMSCRPVRSVIARSLRRGDLEMKALGVHIVRRVHLCRHPADRFYFTSRLVTVSRRIVNQVWHPSR
jgi:hypothetical protein